MTDRRVSRLALLSALGLSLLLGACASKSPAPIVDRSPTGWMSWPAASAANAAPPPEPASAIVPVEAPAGVGYHRVDKADTLYSIALDNGQDYKEVAEWNGLADPAQMNVGQVLRVIPPGSVIAGNGVAVSQPIGSGSAVETAPLDSGKAPTAVARASTAPASVAVASKPASAAWADCRWAAFPSAACPISMRTRLASRESPNSRKNPSSSAMRAACAAF